MTRPTTRTTGIKSENDAKMTHNDALVTHLTRPNPLILKANDASDAQTPKRIHGGEKAVETDKMQSYSMLFFLPIERFSCLCASLASFVNEINGLGRSSSVITASLCVMPASSEHMESIS